MADDAEKCSVEGCDERGTMLVGGGEDPTSPDYSEPKWYCVKHAIPLLDYEGHKLLGRRDG
jgi:hypothetical protein